MRIHALSAAQQQGNGRELEADVWNNPISQLASLTRSISDVATIVKEQQ
jgi:hypothetical protein